MSDEHPVADAVVVKRFWHNYLSILEKARISKAAVPWYRKHAEAYIRAHRGLRLASHSPRQIDDYLNEKGRLPAITEWQFRQIADSLRLLFCELIRPEWAAGYDWYQWRALSRELESDHPTLLRDGNPSLLVAPSTNQLITRFRETFSDCHTAFVKTVRVRQMAVRTEQTYEHWITRFLQFHHWRPVGEIGGTEIGAYLEHLAVVRRVSPSTQKIALNALIFLFREVLGCNVDEAISYTHSRKPRRIPSVLSRDDVKALLAAMRGRPQLMASLMYGTGKGGKDIRLVQEISGHADVSTTMIYTHVLNRGGLAVASPFDDLSL